MDILNHLLDDPVFSIFYNICQIPHGSGNEFALGKWIVQWAQARNFYVIQDEVGNVLIRNQLSADNSVPTILLQAHLDMICAKTPLCSHNFETDSIKWVVEDDILSTGHQTTLGADNGIGVAVAMAMLNEKFKVNLEVLLTVGEEDDFRGASSFDYSLINSKILINLDHSNEKEIICGSCGGMQVNFFLPVVRQAIPEGWETFELKIDGLIGGHSGKDIALGHGNAIVVLARVLDYVNARCECMLCNMTGGNFRLSIPRSSVATVCIPKNRKKSAIKAIDQFFADLRKEFSLSSKSLNYTFDKVSGENSCVEMDNIIRAILLIPDGIFQMSESLHGQVVVSDNLGEIYLKDNNLEMVLEIRSEQNSLRNHVFRCMQLLAELLGGTCDCSNIYPSWYFNSNSMLLSVCEDAYKEIYHSTPDFSIVHAGLEVGYLCQKIDLLDAVSIGPNIWNLHTADECLSISSVKQFYEYLKKILSLLSS